VVLDHLDDKLMLNASYRILYISDGKLVRSSKKTVAEHWKISHIRYKDLGDVWKTNIEWDWPDGSRNY
jgi:hypothetical protein